MSFQRIMSLLDKVQAKRVLLLCHQNADPDALCASFAMSRLLEQTRQAIEVEVASPEGVSRLSKKIMDCLPVTVKEEKPCFEKADVIFMLDTNTVLQLGDWSKELITTKAPVVVIDHHASHPETEKISTIYIHEENSSSTCEMVLRFFRDLDLQPSQLVAKALFLGIAFDTKHFILANSETFEAVGYLVETGVNAKEALSLLSLPMNLSERIARLKAGQRLKLTRINDWIVAFSHVRSFQASAARAFIELGAHVAIVVGQNDDEVQISLRANQDFYKSTNFHLGRDLAKPLGEYLHGMGGGHSTSAGVDGTGDFDIVVKSCVKILRQKLGG